MYECAPHVRYVWPLGLSLLDFIINTGHLNAFVQNLVFYAGKYSICIKIITGMATAPSTGHTHSRTCTWLDALSFALERVWCFAFVFQWQWENAAVSFHERKCRFCKIASRRLQVNVLSMNGRHEIGIHARRHLRVWSDSAACFGCIALIRFME